MNITYSETCACGASLTITGTTPGSGTVWSWRTDHRHEMQQPDTTRPADPPAPAAPLP